MRAMIIASVVVGLGLAGCGSSGQSAESPTQSSAPVESISASGAVATYFGECPEGHPARDALSAVTFEGRSSAAHDGVVGTIYNDTEQPIEVRTDMLGSCDLGPGKNTMFAASMGEREGRYYLVPREVEDYNKMFWLYLSSPTTTGETAVGFLDPNTGEPRVFASQRSAVTQAACPPGQGVKSSGDLYPGGAERFVDTSIGYLMAKRWPDDKNVARQGTGWDGWAVNDWARIDLVVHRVGTC